MLNFLCKKKCYSLFLLLKISPRLKKSKTIENLTRCLNLEVISTLTGEISIRERDSSSLYNDEQNCSENTVGQVYNPFNITGFSYLFILVV